MKHLLTTMLAAGFMLSAAAPEALANNCPNLFNFQGRLTDSTGSPISNGGHAMKFTAFTTPTGGSALWSESTSVSVNDGLFNHILGSINVPPTLMFPTNDLIYIEVAVDGAILNPRTQIVAVGYSRRVYTVEGSAGGTINGDVEVLGKGTIGTGHVNTGAEAFVAGRGNTTSGDSSSVSGGTQNTASGRSSTVGGGFFNFASGNQSTVGGGSQNSATGLNGTVAGGNGNINSQDYGTIGGGRQNAVGNVGATVAGGGDHFASGLYSSIAGGRNNKARGDYSVVCGGGGASASDSNAAAGSFSFVGGGHSNRVTDENGFVGGGGFNRAGDNGGTTSDAPGATVCGGQSNTAGDDNSAVCGGSSNQALGASSFVGGGFGNAATGFFAMVSGGFQNMASGESAAIPGGKFNAAAGAYSFAAGYRAHADSLGCFVWGDSSSSANVSSTTKNQFLVRAAGGTKIYSDGGLTTGVELASGDGTWSSISDRAVKENFEFVDGQEVLDKLSSMPITTWNYKTQADGIRHIGPMAQDFYAAFGVGADDRHITGIDGDGVALAAIQALNAKSKKIEVLEREVAQLRSELSELKTLLQGAAQAQQ